MTITIDDPSTASATHDDFMQAAKKELDDFERRERAFQRQDRQEKAEWLESIAAKYLQKKTPANKE